MAKGYLGGSALTYVSASFWFSYSAQGWHLDLAFLPSSRFAHPEA